MCLNMETELDINMYVYYMDISSNIIYIYVYTEMCRDHTLLNFQAWHDSASSGGDSRIYTGEAQQASPFCIGFQGSKTRTSKSTF